ncbi:capsule polysaccharide biosynthesis protein [Salinisphaera hydrothermalis C41B8]|uniref:Capsule polysaccharide biosynthesis protein n=2 Tax=Salinisphaera TaxID=180541 RepID=A0A084IKW0_SALHC|nr:capsule polysaccharide biosynthesis protein [Salinisphaera hydrothermalis C41B8]
MIEVCFHTYPEGWPWTRRSRRRFRRKRHKIEWSIALRRGFKKHGIKTRLHRPGAPLDADVHVFWGWHEPAMFERLRANGQHALIIERGFLQPRREWASLAFDGLNRRGRYAGPADDGQRFARYFGHQLAPWQAHSSDRVLLIGQVPGDISLDGIDVAQWAADRAARLTALDKHVVYRPHPLKPTPCPPEAALSDCDLATELAAAGQVVTYSSTTGVESVLAGVPVVVEGPGSMAWPMASHAIEAPLVRPDRQAWCCDLAWKQWQHSELADGRAWEHVRHAVGL